MPALAELNGNDGNVRARCEALVFTKIQCGFHRELSMGVEEYRNSFRDAVEGLVGGQEKSPRGLLALVEERIPFIRQLGLLGIKMDPGVFYAVIHHPDKTPYGISLAAITACEVPFSEAKDYTEAIAGLPAHLRPATPFEGINAEIGDILSKTFVTLPGGEYEDVGVLTGGSTRFRSLCLDTYCGKPRISQIRFNQLDRLVGMLVART